jgi:hypothetical protein
LSLRPRLGRIARGAAALAGLVLAVAGAGWGLAGCGPAGPRLAGDADTGPARGSAEAGPGAVAQLHARCVDDMVRQVCRVMSGPEAAAVPADAVVFVAGLGPVQAQVYNELRASGDGMCRTVSARCTEDWDGPPCRTARSLYGR